MGIKSLFSKKSSEPPEIKVHKLEIDKLKLQASLKKEKSEKSLLLVSLSILLFLAVFFLIALL